MTIIAPILPGREEALKSLLREIGNDVENNPCIRFPEFPPVHFARWVVIPPPDPSGPAGPPFQLAFGTDHDGPDEQLLGQMAAKAMDALDAIYSHCDGWPGPGNADRAVTYLLNRRIPYGARHIACRRLTVQDLKDAVTARGRMETYIDTVVRPTRAGRGDGLSDSDARRQMGVLRDYAEPIPRIPPPPARWVVAVAAVGAAGVIGGLSLLFRRSPALGRLGVAALVGLPALFLAALRRHETADKEGWVEATPPTLEHLRELRDWEDHKVQNQMTHVVAVKPGLFRRLTLGGVLGAVNFLARSLWNRGELGGIPTIHFARWMLIDGGKRLLFFSNFDGSWENYLSDFIDRASAGLTGVWSNTVGFPPTQYLINDGSRRVEAFKNWTRKNQIETQVWYSAYPDVSVVNLLDALALSRPPAPGTERALLGKL
ncbi:MAG: hypothetical protein JO250_14025 [Armatimonadetes bacterium]|nr:hypothetical protein [Armatimonadota bacterium]